MEKCYILKVEPNIPRICDNSLIHCFHFANDFVTAVKKAKQHYPYSIAFNIHETSTKLFFNVIVDRIHATCLLEDDANKGRYRYSLN